MLIRDDGDLRAMVLTPALRAEASGRSFTPVLRLGLAYVARVAGLRRWVDSCPIDAALKE